MNLTEQQLNRAIYSLWDLQQALSALTFLLEDCDFAKEYDKVSLRRFRCYEANLIMSLARPFEKSRVGTTLGLRAMGIRLSDEEWALVDRVLEVRRKIVAHSSEEEMHFRVATFPVDGDLKFPHFQFNEGLHLEETELHDLQDLLRKLMADMAEFFWHVAQEHPEFLDKYRKPESFNANEENA